MFKKTILSSLMHFHVVSLICSRTMDGCSICSGVFDLEFIIVKNQSFVFTITVSVKPRAND